MLTGKSDLTLNDLVSRNIFVDWHDDYLQSGEQLQKESGIPVLMGYTHASNIAETLAILSGQYLRAKQPEWYREEIVDDETLSAFFYRYKKDLKQKHQAKGAPKFKVDVSKYTPEDMRSAGEKQFANALTHAQQTRLSPTDRARWLMRLQISLYCVLASLAPFRVRNWVEMCWGTNLSRLPNGLWQVYFEGKALKVTTRKGKINIAKFIYPAQMSVLIDKYLAALKHMYGDDVTERTPYVMTPDPNHHNTKLKKPESESETGSENEKAERANLFNEKFQAFWLEVFGTHITTHATRRIVATFLIRWGFSHGIDGLMLAAFALNDTIKTIFDEYYEPNYEEFAKYAQALAAGKLKNSTLEEEVPNSDSTAVLSAELLQKIIAGQKELLEGQKMQEDLIRQNAELTATVEALRAELAALRESKV